MLGSMCILGGGGWLTIREEFILQQGMIEYEGKDWVMRDRTVNPWRAMTSSSCSFVFATVKS